MSLRVLITNFCLNGFTGTELFVRDLALELRRQGHSPSVFARSVGGVSRELSEAHIPVATSLQRLDLRPDIIHGHHRYETLCAIRRFPDTPALFFCHDHQDWLNIPPLHSHILMYFGVSDLCLNRLRTSGVPEARMGRFRNFVDIARFKPRYPLPQRPGRALLFSNYARNETYIPAVIQACREAGLQLDVAGKGAGMAIEQPEVILGRYDIVFAKAKAAMEAMAVGCAVVLCDFGGVGPMVTSDQFFRLREMNFGFQALTEAHTAENLLRQIGRYDQKDAERVRDLLRSSARLDHAIAGMIEIYERLIAEYRARPPIRACVRDFAAMADLIRAPLAYRAHGLWAGFTPEKRQAMRSNSGFRMIEKGVRRILTGHQK